ncbi:carbon-nitrogen hydrolase family protein [Helicobacter sp. 13S00401-1]|uniref:carbon-nitrogen hydrolase family protein n=1 Tax=Helicobacter sp. 13S00401-1 TaxID=1905758 RepID=UPI000BA6BB7B|nr:carbon-nitrogen hydrolase family protein [Helicobacter sp. 13S00401-1]PAF50294.1 carbon-nitrogen hydrolase family protein [Helicobacter sp. 13S00401-1]
MTTFKTLNSLQLETTRDFQANLELLEYKLRLCEEGSINLVSEVFLTGFSYEHMEEASSFSVHAKKALLEISKLKTILITLIEKIDGECFNVLNVFHKGKIIYTQKKAKLFCLGKEHIYFKSGSVEDIKFFKIDNIVCASLICFELRFIELWQRLRGAEIIFVPALWGKDRKTQFESLCRGLAIANQCFVVSSLSGNKNVAQGSSIITPFGLVFKNDDKDIVTSTIDLSECQKMRNHIDVGLSQVNLKDL